MKKITLITIPALFIIVLVFYFYSQNSSLKNKEVKQESEIKQNQDLNKTKDKVFKNMVFSYPVEELIVQEEPSNFALNLNIPSVMVNEYRGEKITVNKTPVYFNISKNDSPKDISMEEWLDQNAPYKDKGSSQLPISTKILKIKNNDAILLFYKLSNDPTGYSVYNHRSLYIFHNGDVYQIDSLLAPEISEDSEFVLNEEETKNIKDYEKIVDEIIQSIHFVN